MSHGLIIDAASVLLASRSLVEFGLEWTPTRATWHWSDAHGDCGSDTTTDPARVARWRQWIAMLCAIPAEMPVDRVTLGTMGPGATWARVSGTPALNPPWHTREALRAAVGALEPVSR